MPPLTGLSVRTVRFGIGITRAQTIAMATRKRLNGTSPLTIREPRPIGGGMTITAMVRGGTPAKGGTSSPEASAAANMNVGKTNTSSIGHTVALPITSPSGSAMPALARSAWLVVASEITARINANIARFASNAANAEIHHLISTRQDRSSLMVRDGITQAASSACHGRFRE